MNDRFKFRVWDSKDENYIEELDIVRLTQSGKFIFNNAENNTEPALNPNRFIFEQCTGLKDKNGNLIYEGDIFQCPQGIYTVAVDSFGLWTAVYKNDPLLGVGEWSDFVKNYLFDEDDKQIEIIGNIQENGDLLNETR